MASISQAIAIAFEHHRAGRLQVAEQIYRQILAAEPNQADALQLLGMIAYQTGHHAAAVEYIGRAIAVNPSVHYYHANLGNALQSLGRLDEAIACYHRALAVKPDYSEACNNLANALRNQGKLDEPIAWYRRAIELDPNYADAHTNLGNALQDQAKLDEAALSYRRAVELNPRQVGAHCGLGGVFQGQGDLDRAANCYRRALELNPAYVEAHNNLGVALQSQGKLHESVDCFRRALELQPGFAEAHDNLGRTLTELGQLDRAVDCFRRAIELMPRKATVHNHLAIALHAQGKLDEAMACCRTAIALEPGLAEAHNSLGNALRDAGLATEAIACYRRAVELGSQRPSLWSGLLYGLYFCPQQTAATIYDEHRRWARQRAERLAMEIRPHANDRTPDRRLRVGYVSPDLRNHPVGRFLLPLLEAHDHRQVEVVCYASVSVPDAVTEQLRGAADVWRDATALGDEPLAAAIRDDRIDILVDLTMHMAGSRLLTFARKPAPVQLTYLAYCGTTGLTTIDCRLTDPYLDPPGVDDRFYSEQSIRLPETYWCYRPVPAAPAVSSLPALEAGHVTFGCLNNFCKVSQPTLRAWCQLLGEVAGSRLLLHAKAGSHRQRVYELAAGHHITPDRIAFVDLLPPEKYFQVYRQIDVALDPFPYGGGTTTLDALWMGVPVVSLAGPTAVGRSGLSILSNLGLPELVARNPSQYVSIAAVLAANSARLADLRATLRQRMQDSPLLDAPRFARGVEAAYRAAWRRWCGE